MAIRVDNTYNMPYKFVGKLFYDRGRDFFGFSQSYYGTAFMISDSAIITAAHNIYDFKKKKFSKRYRFKPAYNNRLAPFGHWKAVSHYIPEAWLQNGSASYDYGIIVLENKGFENIGTFLGGRFEITRSVPQYNTLWTDVGYPSNIDCGRNMCFQVGSFAGIVSLNNESHVWSLMSNNMHAGSSGGPWILDIESDSWIANGIHVGRVKVQGNERTYSPPITEETMEFVHDALQ